MNPYRTRTPTVSGVAVTLVVLLAIGAIVASIVLGPKPNTTVVNLQPIRPAQTATPTTQPQPSADPVASIPAEELPVVESRPTQPAPDRIIEGSELGVEPSQAVTPDASASTATDSSARPSSAQAATTSTTTREPAASAVTTSPPTQARATPAATPTRTVSSNTSAPTAQPAVPSAFLRRSTNGVSVQVGAFRNVDSAAKLAQELARKGFTASVQPSGGLYRVVIGPYKDDATARAAAARAR